MGSFWKDRPVLITGASGMIGSCLVAELLDRGASITALVKDMETRSELFRSGNIDRVAVANGTLEDFWTLESAINVHEVEVVFHLGAQTIVGAAHLSPLPTFEANIRGTYNLLEACRLHSDNVSRVIVASSDKAYGAQEVLPYTEDMRLDGRHPYEVSKSCADILAQAYFHTYGMSVAIARCGNVFGGGDLNWSRIVPGTIRSLLRGERPIIRSDGTYLRDYIYVKDVVTAYVLLAERLEDRRITGQAFNFSAERPMSALEIVQAILAQMGRRDIEPEILGTAEGEIRNQYLSFAKARDTLGWTPEYSLEWGLGETIAWYESFFVEPGEA